MTDRPQDEVSTYHLGPVYEPRPPLGDSLAACRPGPHDVGMLTGDRRLVNCEACKATEDYKHG